MSQSECEQVPIIQISDADCAYLFWTTGPKMSDCLSLIKFHNLVYLTCFTVWRKLDKGKLYCSRGSYTKPNFEYVLLAQRGDI